MSGLAEKAGFGLLAAGLHALAFAALPGNGVQSRGAGGESLVTLQGATPQFEAMVAAWTAPPETAQPPALTAPQPPAPDLVEPQPPQVSRAPEPVTAPARPNLPDSPAAPAAAQAPLPARMPAPDISQAPALPRPNTDPVPDERPEIAPTPPAPPRRQVTLPPDSPVAPAPPEAMQAPSSPPPPQTARPDPRPAPRAQTASTGVQAQRAAGRGGASQAGTSGRAESATLSPGQRRSLMAAWGAQIRTRIERTKRFPRGVRGGGRVVLSVRVSRAGTLQGVAVRKSSGKPELDAAALRAVQRAGRFPAAPGELKKPVYTFSLPVNFSG